MVIDKVKRLLKQPEYHPLNTIEISKKSLLLNLKVLSKINLRTKLAPVLKSNAYGHGIIEIAKILDNKNLPFFCVDSIYEAYQLFKEINTKILITGFIDPENLKVKELPFSYAVSDLKLLQAINDFQPEAGVHLFIDTGMHREGITLEHLPAYLKQLTRLPNIKLEGLMSHFASADEKTNPQNKLQIKNFEKAIKMVKTAGFNPKYTHIANSDGLINFGPKLNSNLARPGLALWGISKKTTPILKFKSRIIQIKRLQKGDNVGYSGSFKAKKAMTIGIIPAGYNDGVDRRLSNIGFVTVNGIACKIIGRVSMNITTIDLSEIEGSALNQEVIIYSDNPKDVNSIENTAKLCKTIPYELLIHLSSSTKRVVV